MSDSFLSDLVSALLSKIDFFGPKCSLVSSAGLLVVVVVVLEVVGIMSVNLAADQSVVCSHPQGTAPITHGIVVSYRIMKPIVFERVPISFQFADFVFVWSV